VTDLTRWCGRRRASALLIGALFAAALAAMAPLVVNGDPKEYRATFPRTVGLYVGSQVSVLGVKVGEVTDLDPQGTAVHATFELDDGVRIPAQARAVVVAPTLVSDRRLELTPSYDGGPTLAPGQEIPLERTAVPVEIDEVLGSVEELSTALGPRGANRDGALNEVLEAGSRTLRGNGERLNAAVVELSRAVGTAAGSGGDLATTLNNLAQLTRALVASDAPVRQLAVTLRKVSRSLASQRDSLVGTVDGLAVAMAEIRSLVKDSGPALTRNVAGVLDVTRTLLKEEQALRETLNLAPVTLQNFIGTFDPQTSALTARIALNGTATTDPSLLLCQLVSSNGLDQWCPTINRLVDPLEPLLQRFPQPLGEGPELGDGVPEGRGDR
jgi:phospholipid/cholesterol/gamma-HCH transport system substrate-binding protein